MSEKLMCPDCGLRPAEEFGFDKTRINGRTHYCRKCKNSRNRESWAKKKAEKQDDKNSI